VPKKNLKNKQMKLSSDSNIRHQNLLNRSCPRMGVNLRGGNAFMFHFRPLTMAEKASLDLLAKDETLVTHRKIRLDRKVREPAVP
jgi:hypothetical protein